MIQGADLAWCNPQVDYVAMKAAGIRFTCIKLGQGMLPKDVMFDTHRSNCDVLGIPWDLYWFCDYRYTGGQNVQQLIIKANGNYGRKHVVQDLEFYDYFGARPDGAHMLRFCLDFFDALELTANIIGYLYTNRDIINQMWAAATADQKMRLLRHPLWIASDTKTPIYSPWPKYTLNQWELDIVMPWAHGSVDLDEFNGDDAEFQTWIGGTTPAPLTLEQRVKRLEDKVFGGS